MKKLTKNAINEFVKKAEKIYEDFYFKPNEPWGELPDAIDMLMSISDMWDKLMRDECTSAWYEGNRLICEAIGTTFMYWDTDVVDQLSFIDDLEKIANKYYEDQRKGKVDAA